MKLFLPVINLKKWQWLYAPSKPALGFACRTGVTSIVALYIALWMEMSSPFWAPLTVWMVSLLTPEESNAKSRWHLFGTILGTFAAVTSVVIFPQQASLFMITLAFWVSLCCFLATLLNNYRVHGMRVSAFTYALIAIDAIPNPNQAFDIAMARASYIILAIILQKTATSICVGGQRTIQIQWLQNNLDQAISKTCFVLSSFFKGNISILEDNKNIFSIFYKLNQQSEFTDMAIAPHSHLGAHGRMILAIANNILFKTFCLQKLAPTRNTNNTIQDLPKKAAIFFTELPDLIKSNTNVNDTLKRIKEVRNNIYKQLLKTAEFLLNLQDKTISKEELLFAELSIVYDSLSHLEYMFIQLNNHTKSKKATYYNYRINTYRNLRKSLSNGLRVFISIILASIIWQVTAWSNGMLFVMYVAIICAITSIADRPAKAAKHYLNGAVYAILSTFLINFILIPPVSNFEILTIIVLPFMFIAGLASCNPAIALTGIAYNFLFSVLISYNNQSRINEITYFNLCLALICAIIFTWLMCRLIFPINDTKEYCFTCKQMILNLSNLPNKYILPSTQKWIDQQISNLVYLIDDTKNLPKENQNIYFYGAQSIILTGVQIIQIRIFLQQEKNLPVELKKILNSLLYQIHILPKLLNTQSIDKDYQRFKEFLVKDENAYLKQTLLPILSSICIIKSQLNSYKKFIKLFSLSQKKYFKL
ncbi:FUSC family protein [Commensalibacter papalotli (ex Servin-Garciduenas et al. 2014)]|uniref:Fusaric acid resistance protein n=1 Tax=Commensalibacter papalotli (ex Servin-Garciduenas et al. 2014) TaxID=1208583 RepID=W7DNP5_9PROT|nr:FUSC family protein [Commensalibacter papalotli (ex Servin-Garciduenas et al. 2014)]EUK18907.1 fusaric acid resistance protein [Commensalibacter papalotli (ex Servin-Garciduenas et al. 2014)]